ncbi:MAG: hypothetical protein ABL931_13225 [Usitatibacteraceae bacterium]
MGRIVVALVSAVIGGALFGIGATFFQGMVPDNGTRWAFYFFFGIPAWIIAQLFGEALYGVVVPAFVQEWGNVARSLYLIILFSLTVASALITSATITS